MKKRYQFGGTESSDFFNQIAQMYAAKFQDGAEQPAAAEEEQPQADPNAGYDSDYEDLLGKYNDLQGQFDQLSNQVKTQMPVQNSFNDNFLDFLFFEPDNNMPINPDDLLASPKPTTQAATQSASAGVNPYLKKTESELFDQFPGLSSKGIWGDKAHQQRKSDHNTGDAEDFGFPDTKTAQALTSKLQSEAKDKNIKYIIYNGQIWNPEISNDWRPYNGPNPHKDHVHVSYKRKLGGYAFGGGEGPTDPGRRLQPSEMQQWNRYLDYVKAKGYQGSKDLDVRDKNLGAQLFDSFKKETGATIDYSIVPLVQSEFQRLQTTAQEFDKRRGKPSAAFSDISKADNWFGSLTSQQYFPSMELQTYSNGKLVSKQNQGLVDGSLHPVSVSPTVRLPKGVQPWQSDDGSWYYTDPKSGDAVSYKRQYGGARDHAVGNQYKTPDGVTHQEIGLRPPLKRPQPQYGPATPESTGQKVFNPSLVPLDNTRWFDYKDKANTEALKKANSRHPSYNPVTNKLQELDSARYFADRQLLMELGSPNVDYADEEATPLSRAHFNPFTNTISLKKGDIVLQETGHAYQHNVDRTPLISRFIGDWLQDPYFTPKGQKQLYKRKGSIEHDAHSVIDPTLFHKYWDIKDSIDQEYSWGNRMPYGKGPGVSELSPTMDTKDIKKQTGGVANTIEEKYKGLNDPKYNKMFFPMTGTNMFRGLDNGQPVLLQDQIGNKKVLKGKYDVAHMVGNVFEHRL